jgi:hypothetical protein
MMIGIGPLILTLVAWSLKTAMPSLWHRHIERQTIQVELAKDLCENHCDCEAQKALALRGIRKKVK